MTSPTSALFSGNFSEKNKSWKIIKVFWYGFQIAKKIGSKDIENSGYGWRIYLRGICLPNKGIGGGNFLILGEHIESVLSAAELAVSKINQIKM